MTKIDKEILIRLLEDYLDIIIVMQENCEKLSQEWFYYEITKEELVKQIIKLY